MHSSSGEGRRELRVVIVIIIVFCVSVVTRAATDVKAYFDRAVTLAREFPTDSVLTYSVRKITHYMGLLKTHEWEVCRLLIMRCCLGEPTMLPVLLPMFEVEPESWTRDELRLVLTELCLYHGQLQHGFEVAWSLWTARSLGVDLPDAVSAVVKKIDDDTVALVALDLEAQGLLPPTNSSLWKSRMTADALYSDHWLLACEALVKGWLPSKDGIDYVAPDPFFSILKAGHVEFYDVEETWEDGYSDYSDGGDEVWDGRSVFEVGSIDSGSSIISVFRPFCYNSKL